MINRLSPDKYDLLVLVAVIAFPCSIANGQTTFLQPNCSERCAGDKEIHHKDFDDFNSYTRVFEENDHFVFQTCVENTSNKDLEVNWYIPGPDNWIPKSCSNVSNREKSTKEITNSYRSCLRFGNSWNHLRAKFLPHVTDERLIEVDKTWGPDCSSKPVDFIVPPVPQGKSNIRPLQKHLEFFAPANEKNPQATLTKITLQIGVFPIFDNAKIVQNIEYQSEPAYLDNKEFKFTRFIISPPESVRKYFLEAANGDNINKDGTFNFDQSGKVSITYATPPDATLSSARYTIFNQNQTRVGSILIPTWLSK